MILAFDVSNSMRADDLEPTRMAGGEGRGHGVRGAAAEHDPDRCRGVRRERPDGAPADHRQGGGGRGDPAALGERRHLARPGPLHLAQHDRGKAAADRRVRARERRRRGRHRLLRLVGDRSPLGRGEHLASRSPAARRGCVLGGRPRPCDRDRDTGGSGGRDRRIQRRDGARRGAADRDRGRDRRLLQPGRRRRPRSSGSTTPSTSSSLASSGSTR